MLDSKWMCHVCTVVHELKDQQQYLACVVCGTPRRDAAHLPTSKKAKVTQTRLLLSPSRDPSKKKSSPVPKKAARSPRSPPSDSSSWGSLRPPSEKDVVGPRKRHRAFDAPPALLDYIVVLDFEWTADNRRKIEPIAEITQFPSVIMKLFETNKAASNYFAMTSMSSTDISGESKRIAMDGIDLPDDLTRPTTEKIRHDALVVGAFDTFVRPTLNPKLTPFSIELTAITQEDVDHAPAIENVVQNYTQWLHKHGLVDEKGRRVGNWCFATWGDGDIMSTLLQELNYKNIRLPLCFDRWINLKADSIYKKHYHREPRGGLRHCVESVGAIWEGRAHNGLVDSINTAKIVRRMAQTGFRFTKSTRGLDQEGRPFGQRVRAEKSPPLASGALA